MNPFAKQIKTLLNEAGFPVASAAMVKKSTGSWRDVHGTVHAGEPYYDLVVRLQGPDARKIEACAVLTAAGIWVDPANFQACSYGHKIVWTNVT